MKSTFNLKYTLFNGGWAVLEIGDMEKAVTLNISFFHDSLKELAQSAIVLRSKEETSVVFRDEPGEHRLILKKSGKNIIYELRWYKGWASWNLLSEDHFETILSGTTTLPKYINLVRENLIRIRNEEGIEGYKKKWSKHDFPLNEYELLKG
ncbi:hypothetical protein HMPREF3127_20085 [Sphingobacterium sp. HMSC13C05]|uniref:hypothetical protein n=1 Tax=Sphingobacterium sp. HMSC13C05 TaxID=1581095 RepID=UPI0008A3471D|nr:hypothetical protein [Sphingobacterium sp. HMSC13C05]OFV11193.1 hypothetical protein HMPREF3127_20085 [Sphingobacterium sp. HMSC13C05]